MVRFDSLSQDSRRMVGKLVSDSSKVEDGNYRIHLDNGDGGSQCGKGGKVHRVDISSSLSCLDCRNVVVEFVN